ncbi:MAG TPA: amidohydrolase family protein [Gemmatimonadaceae bacterium]|nr:amidohydrolase family protein [Gemmatimonadaceae bacterium]
MKLFVPAVLLVVAACAPLAKTDQPIVPLVDYHEHLVSAPFAPIVKAPERNGAALVRELDQAGIERALVLSVGYSYADERKKLNDPDRLTREENDWTSAEVVKNAPRLVGFCSANPLRDAALAELERCLHLPGMKGIKLHFGNAGVSLRIADHLARIQQVFSLAERLRVPVLVHMRARGGTNYGAEDARLFIEKVIPKSPDIDIIVAHFGGAGPGYPDQADSVMAEFGAAGLAHDARLRHVYFDVATIVTQESTPADGALVAKRIREVGADHVLYGSDLSPPGGSIHAGWEIFRSHVPLTQPELKKIAGTRLSFMR